MIWSYLVIENCGGGRGVCECVCVCVSVCYNHWGYGPWPNQLEFTSQLLYFLAVWPWVFLTSLSPNCLTCKRRRNPSTHPIHNLVWGWQRCIERIFSGLAHVKHSSNACKRRRRMIWKRSIRKPGKFFSVHHWRVVSVTARLSLFMPYICHIWISIMCVFDFCHWNTIKWNF